MPYSVFDSETAKSMKQIFDLGEPALWAEFVEHIRVILQLNQEQVNNLLTITDDFACRAFNQYAAPVLTRRLPTFKKPEDIICP